MAETTQEQKLAERLMADFDEWREKTRETETSSMTDQAAFLEFLWRGNLRLMAQQDNLPDEFDESPESIYGPEPSLEYRRGWNAALREIGREIVLPTEGGKE